MDSLCQLHGPRNLVRAVPRVDQALRDTDLAEAENQEDGQHQCMGKARVYHDHNVE